MALSPAYYLSVASPHPQGKDQALRVSFHLLSPASPLTSPSCLLVSAPTLLNVWLFSENARPSPASGPLLDTCQLHTPWPANRIVDLSLSQDSAEMHFCQEALPAALTPMPGLPQHPVWTQLPSSRFSS